jgi:hypothetical protein
MSEEPTKSENHGSDSTQTLEDLPFDELRQRAFHLAERHLDVGFFASVFSHMPGMVAIQGEGGDLGSTGGTIIETVKAAREMFAKNPELDPDTEAILRARFATYLREHESHK